MHSLLRRLGDAALTLGAVVGAACLVATIAAVLFGVHPLIFRSGSMAPTIPAGSLALAQELPADRIQVGDIVTVPWQGARVTHRVVAVTHRGDSATLRLKGDANGAPDPASYDVRSALRVSFSVPWLGSVVAWLSRAPGIFVLAAYAGLLLVLLLRRPPRGDGGATDRPVRRSRRLLSGRRARRLAMVAAPGTLLLGVAPATWAAWSDSASASGSSMATGTLSPPTNLSCSNNLLSTPTLSWTAPTGTPAPQDYVITIQGTGTISSASASATTTGTSWQFNAGLLTLLGTYNVSVQARYYNWLSVPTGTKAVNVTVIAAGNLGVATCA